VDSSDLPPVAFAPVDIGSSAVFADASSDAVDPGSAFSFNRASRPSTLLRSASRTSVFGPLFLGTASTVH